MEARVENQVVVEVVAAVEIVRDPANHLVLFASTKKYHLKDPGE